MNAAPVTPADFKAIVSDPSNTLCGNFINVVLKLPQLIWQMANWGFDASGNVSNAVKQQIIPPGMILPSATLITDETAWLLCDGREVAKADYPDLYAAIQDIFGVASSALNFKVPDCRGKFFVGVGGFDSGATVGLGAKVGSEKVKLAVNQMPPHTHDINGLFACGLDRNSNNNGVTNNNSLSDAAAFTLTSENSGGTGTPPVVDGHDNIPPSIGLNYFIKV